MSRTVFIAGVGMIPFTKPGASKLWGEMGAEATTPALRDADLGVRSGATGLWWAASLGESTRPAKRPCIELA